MSDTSDLDSRRQAEFAYYADLYARHGYDRPTRRHDAVRRMMLGEIARLKPGSWLDVGSGAVDYSDVFPKIRREDPAFGGLPLHLIAEAGLHDIVTCFDVLEHLLSEDLEEASQYLSEVHRKALYVSVGAFPSSWNGRPAHLTVESPEGWDRMIRTWFERVVRMPDLQPLTPCWRIE